MLNKIIFSLLVFSFSLQTWAHGSMEVPLSRIYRCYQEGPENVQSDACKAFVAMSGKQPLYDWDMVNQSQANDQHRMIIPDGTLCAGGRDKYKGLNLPRLDWYRSDIKADANGRFNFIFRATVPHASKYFELYLTKDEYDFTQPLKWSDLESTPFCKITNVTLENGRYQLNCPLPNKTGHRILYMIWQRIDSPEAFYSCSDVNFLAQQQTNWHQLDTLHANTKLGEGSKVVLWLIKDCDEAAHYMFEIGPGQTEADQWPYYLAQSVNSTSQIIHIGQLNANSGEITPVKNAHANYIYLSDPKVNRYFFIVDFLAKGESLKSIKNRLPLVCQRPSTLNYSLNST